MLLHSVWWNRETGQGGCRGTGSWQMAESKRDGGNEGRGSSFLCVISLGSEFQPKFPSPRMRRVPPFPPFFSLLFFSLYLLVLSRPFFFHPGPGFFTLFAQLQIEIPSGGRRGWGHVDVLNCTSTIRCRDHRFRIILRPVLFRSLQKRRPLSGGRGKSSLRSLHRQPVRSADIRIRYSLPFFLPRPKGNRAVVAAERGINASCREWNVHSRSGPRK